mgnify:CR=1 FL=1
MCDTHMKQFVPHIYCTTKFISKTEMTDLGTPKVTLSEVADISEGTQLNNLKCVYKTLKTIKYQSVNIIKDLKDCIYATQTLDSFRINFERFLVQLEYSPIAAYASKDKNVYKFEDPNLECIILLSLKASFEKLKNDKTKITPCAPCILEAISNLSAELFEADKKRWVYVTETKTLTISDTAENPVEVNDNFYHVLSDLTMYTYNICKLYETLCIETREKMTQICKKI